MLARANRVTRPADFRAAVRGGRRSGAGSLVVHAIPHSEPGVRFGFVVSKAVGNAVKRNVVRRRLRAASRELLPRLAGGYDIVVRAQPGAADMSWAVLRRDLTESVGRAVRN